MKNKNGWTIEFLSFQCGEGGQFSLWIAKELDNPVEVDSPPYAYRNEREANSGANRRNSDQVGKGSLPWGYLATK